MAACDMVQGLSVGQYTVFSTGRVQGLFHNRQSASKLTEEGWIQAVTPCNPSFHMAASVAPEHPVCLRTSTSGH